MKLNAKRTKPTAGRSFLNGLILAFLVAVLALGALYQYFGWGKSTAYGDPAELVEAGKTALAAVAERDLAATMTPPKYDSILQPIDQLLREAREKLESADYDPLGDFEFVRARVEPIPPLADAAHRQAMNEKTFLRKEYRFMEQKGDACRYLATAFWQRLEAEAPRSDADFVPSVEDSNRLTAIINNGLGGDPENQFLWYLRALVERRGGAFAAAAASLEKALELDPNFISAWNDLGLSLIGLKEFDRAEEALHKAADLAEEAYARAGAPPGAEYVTALMNLADFHYSLASYYRHEAQVSPAEGNERQFDRHSDAAEKYAAKVREYGPYDPPGERRSHFQ